MLRRKVSIVIPTFNAGERVGNLAKELAKVRDSVSEIIFVDDGSTDGSTSAAEALGAKRILIKHGGPAKARNAGWRAAVGEIIIFLDVDCMPTDGWLPEMLRPLKDKDVVAVQGAYVNATPDNLVSSYEQRQIELRQGTDVKETDNFATYSLAVRKRVLEEVGGFDQRFTTSSVEDTIASYKVSEHGKIIFNPNAKVLHFHRNTLKSYMRKQYIHAKNRIAFNIHGRKLGDKYAGMRILIQPVLALLSVFTCVNPWFAWFFVALMLLQIPDATRSPGLQAETFLCKHGAGIRLDGGNGAWGTFINNAFIKQQGR